MEKLKKLKSILSSLESVVVAYSGGLDSAFLLKTAVDTLGKNTVIAVTARSGTYPYSEYKEARELSKKIGARHVTLQTNELNLKDFVRNPVNRCYYCKRELFKKLEGLRKKYNFQYVIDGTNYDDLSDVRHGMKAARELGVKSPLLDAGLTKTDIRKFSRALGLSTWDKPPLACLASRFPFGVEIGKDSLMKIEKAEDYIRKLGFKQVRVRLHGKIARIELIQNEFAKAMRLRTTITARLRKLGFVYVTLDLAGYRTGSMHEAV